MGPQRVAVAVAVSQRDRPILVEELGAGVRLDFLADLSSDERREALRRADAMLVLDWRRELRPEEREAVTGVRFIQLLSAGADRLPFGELPDSALVAGNVGAYAEPMAEHVMAMTLALAKRLLPNHHRLARGEWGEPALNRSLAGAVCGILGFGAIGSATARLMRAFGARIQAINSSGWTDEPVELIGTLDDLDRVLRASDVLVVALPLTRTTAGLIGPRELQLMKPDAILINVARGAIVDQGALFEHLRASPGFAAGIDAWWDEPAWSGEFRIEHPFFALPNLLGSPHNSASVSGAHQRALRRAARNVARHLRGEPVTGVIRREEYEA